MISIASWTMLWLALGQAGASAEERLLLCRPLVGGDASLARADAVSQAAHSFGQRFLDYGVVCESEAEAARAARRAGLRHALSSSAEGKTSGSRYVLTLALVDAERPVERRELEVVPGADAVAPLRRAMSEILSSVPAPEPAARSAGPWYLVGAGAAALAAGAMFAIAARSAAADADGAKTAQAYAGARDAWKTRRALSGVFLGAGAAAVAGGLAWRFAF